MSPGGWMDIAEVAKDLGVSARTILRDIRAGKLAASQVGARWLVHKDALEAYLRPPVAGAVGAKQGKSLVRVSEVIKQMERMWEE